MQYSKGYKHHFHILQSFFITITGYYVTAEVYLQHHRPVYVIVT